MIKYVFFQRRRLRPPTFESPWIHRGWTPEGKGKCRALSAVAWPPRLSAERSAPGSQGPWLGSAAPHTRRLTPWAPSSCPTHVASLALSSPAETCVRQLLGTQGVSLRVCGAADKSHGPWEPGALRAELSLGGQATAGEALHLLFLPSHRALPAGTLGSVQDTGP